MTAQPFDSGDALYQERARRAFPILIRQATARQPIFYGNLAAELGMPNARNLNYVLGSVGHTLVNYSEETGEQIPPITCLVLNAGTGLPSDGVDEFIAATGFRQLTKSEKRDLVDTELQKIYLYQGWERLRKKFKLDSAPTGYEELVRTAAHGGHAGGESAQHRALKAAVAQHPEWIGLPATASKGTQERPLPSGDVIDVFFEHRGQRIAVEVKSEISDDADLVRGLYQCVKYEAVLRAEMAAEGLRQNVRVCLLTPRRLSAELQRLQTVLGTEVIERP